MTRVATRHSTPAEATPDGVEPPQALLHPRFPGAHPFSPTALQSVEDLQDALAKIWTFKGLGPDCAKEFDCEDW